MPSRGLAVVTGASRGLGRIIAENLALAGYDLLLLSRPSEALDKAVSDIQKVSRHSVTAVGVDLGDERACLKALEGRAISVLVNCGIYQGPVLNARADKTSLEELHLAFQANVLTQFAMTQLALKSMLENRTLGRVFQLVSGSSRVKPTRAIDKGGFQAFAYTATKTAISKLVPLLALEHQEDRNLRFFNIDPGLVITDKMRKEGTVSRFEKYGTNSPEATAAIIVELCLNTALADKYNGEEYVDAPKLYASELKHRNASKL
jgi:NAD(P)-dependent dehydrogenase (short-subunit alcohol dehydrogenase family)